MQTFEVNTSFVLTIFLSLSTCSCSHDQCVQPFILPEMFSSSREIVKKATGRSKRLSFRLNFLDSNERQIQKSLKLKLNIFIFQFQRSQGNITLLIIKF